jgi:mRNA-degrading endonuclease RelE of RelBE toxin-antitoxin system
VKVTVSVTRNFKIAAKPLLKKHRSLSKDLLKLEEELLKNPIQGTPLGRDAYKIRLRISGNLKGKSGGARVITLLETNLILVNKLTTDKEIVVYLLTIYEKSDVANITDKELKALIKSSFTNR